ncbi:MAG: glycoside hydrolase family 38, partial [Betaproteobacteria bacterium]
MESLKAHAKAGRLVLGPWYVASDEFLVSGESLLRNLALGMEQAQAWGAGAQALGYLPDTFGHIAQMPQILEQFGIAHAVVWRGVETPHDFFDWQAPEGSTVATIYLSEGYYLHPLHGPEWMAQTQDLLHKLQARRDPALSGPLLLTHGGDHLAPHPQLAARMEDFNQR